MTTLEKQNENGKTDAGNTLPRFRGAKNNLKTNGKSKSDKTPSRLRGVQNDLKNSGEMLLT